MSTTTLWSPDSGTGHTGTGHSNPVASATNSPVIGSAPTHLVNDAVDNDPLCSAARASDCVYREIHRAWSGHGGPTNAAPCAAPGCAAPRRPVLYLPARLRTLASRSSRWLVGCGGSRRRAQQVMSYTLQGSIDGSAAAAARAAGIRASGAVCHGWARSGSRLRPDLQSQDPAGRRRRSRRRSRSSRRRARATPR